MIQNQKSSDMYFIEIKSTDKAHIQYTLYIIYTLYIYNVHTIYMLHVLHVQSLCDSECC